MQLAELLAGVPGVELLSETFFNELCVRLPGDSADIVDRLAGRGILGGVPLSRLLPGFAGGEDLLLVAVTETATDDDMARLCQGLGEVQ